VSASSTIPVLIVSARAIDAEELFDAQRLERLIKEIESSQGVAQAPDGRFGINYEVLGSLAPGHIEAIKNSVRAANCSPIVSERAAASSAADIAQNISDVAGMLRKGPDVAERVRVIIEGTQATGSWWGLSLAMSHDATRALAAVTTADLMAITSALHVFMPSALGIATVITAVGAAFSGWVSVADAGEGVVVKLYMWVVPWVERA
jgi:hypothetical protein